MIGAVDALGIATGFVESLDTWFSDPTDGPAIQQDATTEFNFGWVFFWNSRHFLESGDPRAALDGNTPFLVDRNDGSVRPIGTGFALHAAIRAYADAWTAPPMSPARHRTAPGRPA